MASEVKEEDYSQTVRNLHNEMVTKLDEEIAPCEGMKDTWDKLLVLFSNNAPLSTKQIHSIKNIGDLFALLMKDNYISFGNYEKFTEKLQQVHKAMARLVRRYSVMINEQIAKDNNEKPKSKKRRRLTDEDESEQTSQEEGIKRKRGGSSNSSRTATEGTKLKLHANMMKKLSEALSSSMRSEWALFKNNMKYHMEIGDAKLADITDMFSACEVMRAKGKIVIGKKYDKLIAVVEDVDSNLVDIINEHLEKMGIEPTQTRKRRRTVSSDSS